MAPRKQDFQTNRTDVRMNSEPVAARIGPAQGQAREDLRAERGKWMWGSLCSKETHWQRKAIRLFQWSVTEYINHIPGQAPCSGVVGQHK